MNGTDSSACSLREPGVAISQKELCIVDEGRSERFVSMILTPQEEIKRPLTRIANTPGDHFSLDLNKLTGSTNLASQTALPMNELSSCVLFKPRLSRALPRSFTQSCDSQAENPRFLLGGHSDFCDKRYRSTPGEHCRCNRPWRPVHCRQNSKE